MRKPKNLKRFIQAFMLLFFVMIVVISCRKDTTDPDPVVPPADEIPPVIPDKKICIMSEYETSRQLPFPGHKINKLGTGLLGSIGESIWSVLSFAGKVVWEAYDFHHTEANFEDIKTQMDDIQNQVDLLNSSIADLANEMNVDFGKLSSYISSTALNEQIAFVQTAMGGGSYNQLMFYPNVAARYQADSTNVQNQLDMQSLRLHAHGFASNIYNDMTPASMTNVINNMNQLLCPTVGSGDNALTDYAKTILDECKGKVNDSATAMKAYVMLESYFLKVVNYQFQAATVMVNACNMLDHNGQHGYASTFWKSEMERIIPAEVDVFISTVDYMVANLTEYRTQERFVNDMAYVSYGIAPDNIFFHALARSRFLANMLYEASGRPRPIICGSVMVPNIYYTDASNSETPEKVTVKIGSSAITSERNIKVSMIPYTYWDIHNTCHPDNKWNFYNFGSSEADTTWTCTPQPIQIVSNSSTSPWPHSVDISWATTPLYYNPSDPSQTSTTRTADCSYQFAYFFGKWQWGYMLLSNTSKLSKLPSPFYLYHYQPNIYGHISSGVPFCGRTTWNQNQEALNFIQEEPKQITFSQKDDYTGAMLASGTINTYDARSVYALGNSRYLSVNTGSSVPPVNSYTNDLEAWGCFSSSETFTVKDGINNALCVTLAATRWDSVQGASGDDYKYFYNLHGDIMESKFYHSQFSTSNSGFGNKVPLGLGKKYHAGVEFVYLYNEHLANNPFDLKIKSSMQYIYRGYYERD